MKNYPSKYLDNRMNPINIPTQGNIAQQGIPEPDLCPVKFVERKFYGQIIKVHEPDCYNKNQ